MKFYKNTKLKIDLIIILPFYLYMHPRKTNYYFVKNKLFCSGGRPKIVAWLVHWLVAAASSTLVELVVAGVVMLVGVMVVLEAVVVLGGHGLVEAVAVVVVPGTQDVEPAVTDAPDPEADFLLRPRLPLLRPCPAPWWWWWWW